MPQDELNVEKHAGNTHHCTHTETTDEQCMYVCIAQEQLSHNVWRQHEKITAAEYVNDTSKQTCLEAVGSRELLDPPCSELARAASYIRQ